MEEIPQPIIWFNCPLPEVHSGFSSLVTLHLIEPDHNKPNKMNFALSKDSDQPGHTPSLISRHCALYGQLRTQTFRQTAKTEISLQADLSLRWAHRSFCLFCGAPAQMLENNSLHMEVQIWFSVTIRLDFTSDPIWAASSKFGTYRLCEQRRFRQACASTQSRQILRCSLIQAVSQEEPSDRKADP